MKYLSYIIVIYALYLSIEKMTRWSNHRDFSALSAGSVVFYSAYWCGYCDKTRNLFKRYSVPFVEYDIESSKKGRQEYEALGGKGVPLIEIGGTVISGYNESRIIDELDRLN